jgi:hypothetical protein
MGGMLMIILGFAISLLAQAADPGQAAPAAPPAPAAAPAAAPEKKICRSMVMTGSIMGKRSCRTNAEWAKLQRSTDEAWESARGKRGFVSRSPSDPQ